MTKLYNILLCTAQGVFLAYDVTYFHAAGLSLALITLASSGFDLSSIFAEFPTSILFDKVSPRMTLVLGNVIRAAGFVLFACFPGSFISVLLGQILTGVGSATESGAVSALYVNDRKSKESSLEKILGELTEATGLSIVLGGVIGAVSYQFDHRLIWIIPACIYLGAIALLLHLPMNPHQKNTSLKLLSISFIEICKKSLRSLDLWIAACLNAGALSIFFLWQIRLSVTGSIGVWSQLLGLIVMNLGSAAGGFFGRRLHLNQKSSLLALIMSNLLICVLFAWTPGLTLGLLLFFIHVAFQAWILNHYYGRIHQTIEDSERATVFSFLSTINALIALVIGPISGWLADTHGLGVGMSASLFMYLVAFGLLGINTKCTLIEVSK
jgi:MFS family permease